MNNPQMIPPRVVDSGPLMENVFEGKEIDLLSLPVPFWHEGDGGRYIGTLDVTISRDPEEGWVNLGCYRVMVHDRDTLALYISPGHHGNIHRRKYFDQGKPFPVAISSVPILCFGTLVRWTSRRESRNTTMPAGVGGEPYEVILGEHTKLPIPAYSEVAVEGEVLPETKIPEGPFGEFTGYYAGGLLRAGTESKASHVPERSDYHWRAALPSGPRERKTILIRAAYIWDYLDKAGVPDVKGIAYYQTRPAGGRGDQAALSRPCAAGGDDRIECRAAAL